jgi:hypothetical protein
MTGSFTNGINFTGGDVTLTDLSMSGSYTNGINVTGGTATIDDVSMTGSYSNVGMLVDGTAASAIITNSNVFNDVPTGSAGHAIYLKNGAVGAISDTTVVSLKGSGIIIANAEGASTITNVIANDNEHYGIRVYNSEVTISGGTMNFNTKVGIIVQSDSTVTIDGVTANSNELYGLHVVEGSSATVTDSSFNSNGLSGVFASDSNTTITLSGASQIKDNQTGGGLLAVNSAVVTMVGGTIKGITGQQAIEVNTNASVTITNPTSLVGDIQTDDIAGASITLNGKRQFIDNVTKTCNISSESGDCIIL